jgi:type IV pilus assembly protein PilM
LFENIAAIDLGATSVKMIKVRTGIRNFQIKSLSYEDIDADNPDYPAAAGAALKKMLADDPVSGFTVISNLPMEKAIIRNITFPFSDVEKIAEAIPFEAEENVPFRLEDLTMDFQALHSGRPDEGRVLLAASRKDTVNDHVRLLQEAGLIPVHLGLEANSLFSCYSYLNRVAAENVIQIDMGYTKSIINIIIDGRLQYTRSCGASVKSIISAMASLLKISAGQR